MTSHVRPVAGTAPPRQLWLPLAGVGPDEWNPTDAPDGERIVADMAAGRPWWELRACDVAPWIRRLPVAIRTDKYNQLGWLGRPWDGASDLPVGEQPYDGERDVNEAEPLVDDLEAWDAAVVPGHELTALLAELRRLIGARPELGVALPDHRDVRATLPGEEGDVSDPTTGMAVIDFDIGRRITATPSIHSAMLRISADLITSRPEIVCSAFLLSRKRAFPDVFNIIISR